MTNSHNNRLTTFLRRLLSPRFLYFYAVLSLAVPNVALCFTERMPFMACLANVLLPLGVYGGLMALSRKTGCQVWRVFLLIFFAAFQLVLIYLYGRGVIAVDMFLNLVTSNPGEMLELLDNLVPAVAGVVVLYVPLLILASFSWARHLKAEAAFCRAIRRAALWCMAAGAVVAGLSYVMYPKGEDRPFTYRAEDHMFPVNVFYNLGLAVEQSSLSANYKERVADFRFDAKSDHPADSAEVYVLVIGETARAANFQLYGYHRPTNPLLSRMDGLTVFSHTMSQSNTTHKSVPMLLSAASAADHDRLYDEKSIITAFHEAGFHTTFVSNQLPNHSYIDFFGSEADDCIFIREDETEAKEGSEDVVAATSDEQLLPYVKRILAKKRTKELIVLHTYGSHFNYRDRYPQSEARFLPDTPTEAKAKNRPFLINAYDNTILQTDRLLASIIGMLRNRGCAAAMIYTSDHGENIFDDQRLRFLHASPVPSAYDLNVPLLVWTSEQYSRDYSAITAALHANRNKDVETSVSLFPTLMSMAGISSPRTAALTPRSLTDAGYKAPRHRLYLDDHNRAVTLRQAGMDEFDFEKMKEWGMADDGCRPLCKYCPKSKKLLQNKN